MSDLDDQSEEVRGKGRKSSGGNTYSRTDGSLRRVAEALVILALAGLGGSVWLLRESVAVLQTSQSFLQKQVDRMDLDQRSTSRQVDEMQGRFYRGMQQGKDPYATDKQ